MCNIFVIFFFFVFLFVSFGLITLFGNVMLIFFLCPSSLVFQCRYRVAKCTCNQTSALFSYHSLSFRNKNRGEKSKKWETTKLYYIQLITRQYLLSCHVMNSKLHKWWIDVRRLWIAKDAHHICQCGGSTVHSHTNRHTRQCSNGVESLSLSETRAPRTAHSTHRKSWFIRSFTLLLQHSHILYDYISSYIASFGGILRLDCHTRFLHTDYSLQSCMTNRMYIIIVRPVSGHCRRQTREKYMLKRETVKTCSRCEPSRLRSMPFATCTLTHISHSSFPYRFHRRLLLLLKLNYSDKVWYAYCLAIGTLTLCCNNSPLRIDLVLWVHRRPSATVVHVISRFFPLKTTLCRNSKSNFIHEKANLVFAPSQTAPRLWPFGLLFFCVCILLRWSNTHTETRVDAASWQCAANPCCGIHFFSSLLIFSCLSLHSFCLLRMHLLCQPVSCCGQVVYCMGLAPNSQFLR